LPLLYLDDGDTRIVRVRRKTDRDFAHAVSAVFNPRSVRRRRIFVLFIGAIITIKIYIFRDNRTATVYIANIAESIFISAIESKHAAAVAVIVKPTRISVETTFI